eukprot:Platyproteum_vivax@DN1408_c0_g1_i1.p1
MNLKIGMMCVFLILINLVTALRISSHSQHHLKSVPTTQEIDASVKAQKILEEAYLLLTTNNEKALTVLDGTKSSKNSKKEKVLAPKESIFQMGEKVKAQIDELRSIVASSAADNEEQLPESERLERIAQATRERLKTQLEVFDNGIFANKKNQEMAKNISAQLKQEFEKSEGNSAIIKTINTRLVNGKEEIKSLEKVEDEYRHIEEESIRQLVECQKEIDYALKNYENFSKFEGLSEKDLDNAMNKDLKKRLKEVAAGQNERLKEIREIQKERAANEAKLNRIKMTLEALQSAQVQQKQQDLNRLAQD